MATFIETIRLATTSPDNELRKENELKLLKYRQTEPTAFLADLMLNFEKEDTDPDLKQTLATIAKVSFSNEIVEEIYLD